MADRLSIYKGALRLLGPSELASLSEDRPERLKLDAAWTDAVELLLAEGMWNFAIRTIAISNDEDLEPVFGYQYAFSKPEDYVRTVALCYTADFLEPVWNYEDEDQIWYANQETIYIRYVSNDEQYGWDVGRWRQPFAKALEAYLAFECGLPISTDRGNRNDLFSLYEKRMKRAKTLDAVDERVRRMPAGRLTRSRSFYNGNRRDRGE